MPITQSRMLSLIEAAEECAARLVQLAKIIEDESAVAELAQGNAREQALQSALDSITSYAARFGEPPGKAQAILAAERMHFKHASYQNIRRAEKMRRRRAEAGTATRGSQPPIHGELAARGVEHPAIAAYRAAEAKLKADEAQALANPREFPPGIIPPSAGLDDDSDLAGPIL